MIEHRNNHKAFLNRFEMDHLIISIHHHLEERYILLISFDLKQALAVIPTDQEE